jgi:hypothetical protein
MSSAVFGSSITSGQRVSPHATAHANTHMIRPTARIAAAPAGAKVICSELSGQRILD